MKPTLLLTLTCLTCTLASAQPNSGSTTQAIQRDVVLPVDFSHVTIQDNFWSPRLEKLADSTLPVCIDQIENKTGRIRNFENAAKGTGTFSGYFFDDSDVYKALEGISAKQPKAGLPKLPQPNNPTDTSTPITPSKKD